MILHSPKYVVTKIIYGNFRRYLYYKIIDFRISVQKYFSIRLENNTRTQFSNSLQKSWTISTCICTCSHRNTRRLCPWIFHKVFLFSVSTSMPYISVYILSVYVTVFSIIFQHFSRKPHISFSFIVFLYSS